MIARFEKILGEVLDAAAVRPDALAQAMRWAVDSGGKRLRPQVCLAAAVAAGGTADDAWMPACAIELLHSYTLVHDDLPAMDNDTMRRGRPSVWAKFGEATAVLAGDALQALAFRTAARTPRCAAQVLAVLGEAALGVVSGQVADLAATAGPSLPPAEREAALEFIYAHKTGDLFTAAAEMGALAAGGDETTVSRLRTYARHLGFAFQYEDDLLDGDDGAFSALPILGRATVRQRVTAHTEAACAALEGLPGDAAFLAELARKLVNRTV